MNIPGVYDCRDTCLYCKVYPISEAEINILTEIAKTSPKRKSVALANNVLAGKTVKVYCENRREMIWAPLVKEDCDE